MNNNQTPQYQSYLGLQKITNSNIELQNNILQIVEWLNRKEELNSKGKKISLKFLDTFFSDTLTTSTLRVLFSLSNKNNISVKILILDPNSNFALSRGKALNQSVISEVNIALFNIRSALQNNTSETKPINKNIESRKFADPNYILNQLEIIRSQQSQSLHIEIKFYDVLTETPVYILSHFLLKGLILQGYTAAENPWLFFINDETQKDDIFDWLNSNFDKIWEGSKYMPTNNLKVLDSHFSSELPNDVIKSKQTTTKVSETNKPFQNQSDIRVEKNFGVIISGGKNDFANIFTEIEKADHLSNKLKEINVIQKDIDELLKIVESDKPDLEKRKFGKKTNNWIQKMVGKSLDGTWQISAGTAVGLLTELLKGFFGM